MNRLLVETLSSLLARDGIAVRLPERVPVNDGGIALGQAWIAGVAFPRETGAIGT